MSSSTVKILHVAGDSKYGGGGAVIAALGEAAQELGWQADVLTNDSYFQRVLLERNIGVIDIPCVWREIRPLRDLRGLFRLYRYLKQSDYTFVHTHTSKGGIIGRIAAYLAGIPICIHTVQGFAFHEESGALSKFIYSNLERFVALLCHCVVTASDYHRDLALKLGIGNPTKTVSIPNGCADTRLGITRSPQVVRQELGIADQTFFILTHGRLATQKGFEYLIKAVPHLASHLSTAFVIIIAGEGILEGDLKALVRSENAEQYVRFLGFRADIEDLLAASDLVVLPSLWEGLSISLLEAMAAEKPIVTTSIGSNVEVTQAGKYAILVPSKDEEKLAEAIASLISNAATRKHLGKIARQVYEEKYTLKEMKTAYQDIYLKLLEVR